MGLPKDAALVCENPLRDVRFKRTAVEMEPRRSLLGECWQQASVIRRAAALLVPLCKETAWAIIARSRVVKLIGLM